MHYAFDTWMSRNFPAIWFERFSDDVAAHCVSKRQARFVREAIGRRLASAVARVPRYQTIFDPLPLALRQLTGLLAQSHEPVRSVRPPHCRIFHGHTDIAPGSGDRLNGQTICLHLFGLRGARSACWIRSSLRRA